jgi:hypothetical protein
MRPPPVAAPLWQRIGVAVLSLGALVAPAAGC